ncbi:hypothetical protein E5F05_18185 [Deinococcus metallilatus]|uniref:DUF4019 domain-containing protein n=1 Tax=Deinococcus metallilatus TaxID=1211322 RepID=A0AAJ5F1G0_9DEIO|nr:hypothetical protein [Deinococcus metallilatus]MBB5296264.1 hypothetical protein [Deinococcus metallilatus]QBY09692.1 hypothetical protein E5F05_18185 [Deinococcus metallilatus]RXJ08890.1 hypothetical protein ERJ73_17020 [Deinococcus metallilatus]TLK23731.1 hypothetical protein FCS05_16060 [Deinococcus metallilatus]GMA14130.1 hypothetical protein GCM10025871_04610 [Deinococcus metallilatus]
MNTLLRPVTLCLTLLAPVSVAQTFLLPAPAPATAAEQAALTRGRALIADFYALRVERMWQVFTAEMRARWGTLTEFRTYREAGAKTFGAEQRVLREQVFTDAGTTYYIRSATFERDAQTIWDLIVGFDAVGRVSLFAIAAEGEQAPERLAWAAP